MRKRYRGPNPKECYSSPITGSFFRKFDTSVLVIKHYESKSGRGLFLSWWEDFDDDLIVTVDAERAGESLYYSPNYKTIYLKKRVPV